MPLLETFKFLSDRLHGKRFPIRLYIWPKQRQQEYGPHIVDMRQRSMQPDIRITGIELTRFVILHHDAEQSTHAFLIVGFNWLLTGRAEFEHQASPLDRYGAVSCK